jgi:hypothetical protein
MPPGRNVHMAQRDHVPARPVGGDRTGGGGGHARGVGRIVTQRGEGVPQIVAGHVQHPQARAAAEYQREEPDHLFALPDDRDDGGGGAVVRQPRPDPLGGREGDAADRAQLAPAVLDRRQPLGLGDQLGHRGTPRQRALSHPHPLLDVPAPH